MNLLVQGLRFQFASHSTSVGPTQPRTASTYSTCGDYFERSVIQMNVVLSKRQVAAILYGVVSTSIFSTGVAWADTSSPIPSLSQNPLAQSLQQFGNRLSQSMGQASSPIAATGSSNAPSISVLSSSGSSAQANAGILGLGLNILSSGSSQATSNSQGDAGSVNLLSISSSRAADSGQETGISLNGLSSGNSFASGGARFSLTQRPRTRCGCWWAA